MIAHDLQTSRETVEQLFAAALQAVEPARAVTSALVWQDGALVVDGRTIATPNGIHIVAIGKAAVAMTRGALEQLNGAIVSGDVIAKEGHVHGRLPDRIRVSEAGHPIPDERGVNATRRALEELECLPEGRVVLALISGGGSALLEAPRNGLSLEDLQRTTDLLLRAGAPIDALNAVRAPLSRVKAGGLRAAAPEAIWITLILSDVLGNDPGIIASGPTVAGRGDPEIALKILDRFGVKNAVPAAVIARLESETAGPRASANDNDTLSIIGDNAMALDAAYRAALNDGMKPRIVWTAVEGEAAALGRDFVGLVADAPVKIDLLLGGGEATVIVSGDGRGGRNTEFTLASALELERRGMHDWVIASLGTDGQDAMTGYAGAIADPLTTRRSRAAGIDPEEALRKNDSLSVFEAAGGAVKTGPTGTNVNDLYFAVRRRCPAQAEGTREG